jgi:uncharacterized repeat protein (TIGR03803 family)
MTCRDIRRFAAVRTPGLTALVSATRKCGISMMLVALWLCASRSQSAGQIFTTLLSFDGTDGANSAAGLVRATDGNFYGTTSQGGANSDGTVFSLAIGLAP